MTITFLITTIFFESQNSGGLTKGLFKLLKYPKASPIMAETNTTGSKNEIKIQLHN